MSLTTCSAGRSNTRIVKSLAAASIMLTLAGLGASQASAVVVERDYYTFTQSIGTWLPDETVIDLDGNTLDSANSANGVSFDNIDNTTTIVSSEVATHAANLATAEVKAYTKTSILSQTGPDLQPQDLTLQTTAAAIIADSFTISANNAAALQPGAMAIVTFTIDGSFNLPAGLDLQSGDFFEAYNAAMAQGSLLLFDPGTFELNAQLTELDRNDFPSDAAFNAASLALQQAVQAKLITDRYQTLYTHEFTVTAFNDSSFNLATDGPAQMILTAQVALDELETSFEWLAQLTTQTTLDGTAGITDIEADFASTGVLTITIPQGFTVTSGSGLFPQSNVIVLGAPSTTATPEPLTAILGVMSLAGLMVATRRRRLA